MFHVKNLLYAIVIVLKNLSTNCNDVSEVLEDRVSGGSNVKIIDYPYQASVMRFPYPGEEEYWASCGGTVYNKRHIITAAHCVFDMNDETGKLEKTPISRFAVFLGREDFYEVNKQMLVKGEQKFGVEKLITHEKYEPATEIQADSASGFDIAILRLDKDIIYTERVKPLRIQTCPPKLNEPAKVSGFGRIDEKVYVNSDSDPIYPKKLQAANLKILTRDVCLDKVIKTNFSNLFDGPLNISYIESITPKKRCINKDYFCAHDQIRSACTGDSGGPLVCGTKKCPKLCGVVSYSEGCGIGQPGFYVDVHKLKCWIRKHAGNQDF